MSALLRVLGALGLGAIFFVWVGLAWAGPPPGGPPIDPKQMSGISRPDPEVPAGAISVRVLLGSFDKPALEHDVALHVSDADGATIETRTAKTGNQGRVTFEDLSAFVGGLAVAEVELDGTTLRSQPIEIRADMGSRVMLVQGAKGAPMDAPLPGIAFEFERSPVGTLMVGTFDLQKRRPIEKVDVTLTITPPDGDPVERKATSDKDGRVVFDELVPPEVPEGSLLQVAAQLVADGPVKRSNSFTLAGDQGMAVVLAEGRLPSATPPAAAGADPHAGVAKRRRLPGPRTIASLPQGTVKVTVVDGGDRPVPDQPVKVIKKNATGSDVEVPAITGANGTVLVSDVVVESDSFYMVGVTYDGAPYSSGFFQLDQAGGVAVDVRVFEVTGDASVVRSAVQYEVDGSENDLARVIRLHEVMVGGDKAFWPAGGLTLDAQDGAKGLTVLRVAEAWLDHEEKADFVTLARPLPPGELVNLSIGYMLEHDGELEVEFVPPFAAMQTAVALSTDLELEAPGAQASDRKSNNPELTIYELGEKPQGAPLKFTVSGLPIRNPIYRRLAAGLGIAMGLALVFGIVRLPRATARQRLVKRRQEFLAMVRVEPPGERRDRILVVLDRIYRQLEALDRSAPASEPPKPQIPAP